MLPGRTYTPEDFIRIASQRKGWIVVPLLLGTLIAVAVGKRLPNHYRSETLIMLVPQRVPEGYVKSTVTSRLEERLSSLNQQILSRSRLERIILDFNLYPSERRILAMEDVVQRMRDDINIKLEGEKSKESAFRVIYVGQDAKAVQRVTERLASLFIEESVRDRENLAEDTNQFLDSQLEDAKRRLIEHEKKLEEYRRRYSGQLPSQSASNLEIIKNTQMQLQTLAEAANRDQERRLLLERQVADLQLPDPVVVVSPALGTDTAPSGESTAQQLDRVQAGLRLLQLRLKPGHPDIRTMERTIRDLQAKLEAEKGHDVAIAPTEKPPTLAEVLRQKRLRDLQAQIDDIDHQLSLKQEQDRRLQSLIAEYQAKLDALPTRESDLVELTRDYTTLQSSYSSLLQKREESKISANLERRNIGEQFRVLDPAREAERPFSPNRPLIDLIGAGAGLALGVLLVGFFELRDSSFGSEADVVRVLDLPVLALVPAISSDLGRKRRGRRQLS